jgi:hypothetical protein
MSEPFEGMQTPEDLRRVFEHDKPFTEEIPEQTLGRLAWLRTRQESEFLLLLADIRLPVEFVGPVMANFTAACEEYVGFVKNGLDEREDPDSEPEVIPLAHPSEPALKDLTIETLDDVEHNDPEYQEDVQALIQAMKEQNGIELTEDDLKYIIDGYRYACGKSKTDNSMRLAFAIEELKDEQLMERLRTLRAEGWPEA